MIFLETVEHLVELDVKTMITARFALWRKWVTSKVHIIEDSLIFMRFWGISSLARRVAAPFQLYRDEDNLVKLFPNFQVLPIYDISTDNSDLVIEFNYPSIFQVHGEIRLKDVVELDQFREIKKLLHF